MGSAASRDKRVFDSLDVAKAGTITYSELEHRVAPADDPDTGVVVAIVGSPLALFHFDVAKDGSMNYDEFLELKRQIRKAERDLRAEKAGATAARRERVAHTLARRCACCVCCTCCDERRRSRVLTDAQLPSAALAGTSAAPPSAVSAVRRGTGEDAAMPDAFDRQPIRCFTTFTKDNLRVRPGRAIDTTRVYTELPRLARDSGLVGSRSTNSLRSLSSRGTSLNMPAAPRSSSSVFQLPSTSAGGSFADPAAAGEQTEDLPHMVLSRMLNESRRTLVSQLKDEKGRNKYKEWLFRLADLSRDNQVSLMELRHVLRAIERDGIFADRLTYERVQPVSPSSSHHSLDDFGHSGASVSSMDSLPRASQSVAKQLMREFDHDGKGYLSQEEFYQLAELIVSEYEFQSTYQLHSTQVGDYALSKVIGKGANGTVLYAYHTMQPVAIKAIRRQQVSVMSRLDVEIQAMQRLSHPNVLSLEEVLNTENFVFLVLPMCGGGSLFDALPLRPLRESEARFIFRQVVSAVAYCHHMGVCHRDLRLENILLANDGRVVVSDFGHAGIMQDKWDLFSTSLVGSMQHISPEQIANRAYSGVKLDVWALGLLLYRLLTNHLPFEADTIGAFFSRVISGVFEMPPHSSNSLQQLLKAMLNVDPEQRPRSEEVMRSDWVVNGRERRLPLHEIDTVFAMSVAQVEPIWHAVSLACEKLGTFVYHDASPQGRGAGEPRGDASPDEPSFKLRTASGTHSQASGMSTRAGAGASASASSAGAPGSPGAPGRVRIQGSTSHASLASGGRLSTASADAVSSPSPRASALVRPSVGLAVRVDDGSGLLPLPAPVLHSGSARASVDQRGAGAATAGDTGVRVIRPAHATPPSSPVQVRRAPALGEPSVDASVRVVVDEASETSPPIQQALLEGGNDRARADTAPEQDAARLRHTDASEAGALERSSDEHAGDRDDGTAVADEADGGAGAEGDGDANDGDVDYDYDEQSESDTEAGEGANAGGSSTRPIEVVYAGRLYVAKLHTPVVLLVSVGRAPAPATGASGVIVRCRLLGGELWRFRSIVARIRYKITRALHNAQ